MDDPANAEALTPIKRALLEIRELRAELARVTRTAREPIAIVGMSLRLPGGVMDAAGLERLLWSKTDAIEPIPDDRFSVAPLYSADPDAPGKLYTRFGGFVHGVERFDAQFFGISPREAATMDPQQRLLLEMTWHALEDAGQSPAALSGSRGGVYVAISNNDYGRRLLGDRDAIDAYTGTGNATSVASGRLSYFLGLHGPSISVDTACSSSLVALHLAAQGLRAEECDLAVLAGINLVLAPEWNIGFSKGRMLAPDGRCKTFDARADGYVRGDGALVMVLKRLSDAVKSGDRIHAVVRGTALNQDGRSAGLTAPNGPAQEAVLRAALSAAGVEPKDIGYLEAHGTGTSLGDPIEVGAAAAVLCKDREHPLYIGSIKTNIGHLEAAAGLAGLAKVVVGLERREIPPNLHFESKNPLIDWHDSITVPTAAVPWVPIAGRRLAGVSSFGFSGTNAHAIVEEAPTAAPREATQQRDRPLHLLALSARDEEALVELAASYATRLESDPDPNAAADVAFSANTGRSHLEHRLAVVGGTASELAAGLGAFAKRLAHPGVANARIEGGARPQIAFLFTGLGAHSVGMGRLLYETSPVFRTALDECAAALAGELPRPFFDVLFGDESSSLIHGGLYGQTATFSVEYALATLWRSWGVEPVAVLGHSLGEYAAACIAGLFSVEDALRLVAERGRLFDELAPGGAMGTVFASAEAVQRELDRERGQAFIACYNGPEHVVVSGAAASVERVLSTFEKAGTRVKKLRVPIAAHSPFVEPALPRLRQAFEQVKFKPLGTTLVSNVTGTFATFEELARPEYWLSHMRQPVLFAASMQAVARQGITHFIEIGPHPVLVGMGAECVTEPVEWLPSLRRDRPDWSDLLESLGRVYVSGTEVRWAAFDRGYDRRKVDLPTYPFQRRRYWALPPGDAHAPVIGGAERWARLATALTGQAERGPLELDARSYPAKWAALESLTVRQATQILQKNGVFARAGEAHRVDDVLAAARIKPNYRHLVERWLEGIVRAGHLRREASTYVADSPLPATDLEPEWAAAERLFHDNRPLFDYYRNCSALAARVLTGEESPLETLFPGGSFELAEALYERSPTMRYVNGLAAAALDALGLSTPPGRALRVLEVGGGTGGSTSSLLPVLPAERARYTFTDVSDAFLERARRRFAPFPFVDYRLFDVDRAPADQGMAPGSFDVVFAANAVHASVDLPLALGRLRELLAPGGVLLLIESTTHLAWFDITSGLIEGWQHFADDLRTDNPLLSSEAWVSALAQAGFQDAQAWPGAASAAAQLGQHVIAARSPGEAVAASAVASDARAPAASHDAQAADVKSSAFRQRLAEALPSDRQDLLRDFVREHVMAVLKLDATQPPGRHDRLMDLGFDSLMAVQLRNALGASLSLERRLPATTLFDYPTIDTLAARLLELLADAPGAAAASAVVASRPAPPTTILGAEAVAAMSDAEVEAALLRRLEGR